MDKHNCIPKPGERCSNEATCLVWFLDYPLYTYMCNDHVFDALNNGVNGYAVAIVRTIEEYNREVEKLNNG